MVGVIWNGNLLCCVTVMLEKAELQLKWPTQVGEPPLLFKAGG